MQAVVRTAKVTLRTLMKYTVDDIRSVDVEAVNARVVSYLKLLFESSGSGLLPESGHYFWGEFYTSLKKSFFARCSDRLDEKALKDDLRELVYGVSCEWGLEGLLKSLQVAADISVTFTNPFPGWIRIESVVIHERVKTLHLFEKARILQRYLGEPFLPNANEEKPSSKVYYDSSEDGDGFNVVHRFTEIMNEFIFLESSAGVDTRNPIFLFAECYLLFMSIRKLSTEFKNLSAKMSCMTYLAFFGVDFLLAKLNRIISNRIWLAAVSEKFTENIDILEILLFFKSKSKHSGFYCEYNNATGENALRGTDDFLYLFQFQVITRALSIKFELLKAKRRNRVDPVAHCRSLMRLSQWINYLGPLSLISKLQTRPGSLRDSRDGEDLLDDETLESAGYLPLLQCLESFHNYAYAQEICDEISGLSFEFLAILLLCAAAFDPTCAFFTMRDCVATILAQYKFIDRITLLYPHPKRVDKLRNDVKHPSYPGLFCFEPFDDWNIKRYRCANCTRKLSDLLLQPVSNLAICVRCLDSIHYDVALGRRIFAGIHCIEEKQNTGGTQENLERGRRPSAPRGRGEKAFPSRQQLAEKL